jgi:methionine-rich copper-binding protein CopC
MNIHKAGSADIRLRWMKVLILVVLALLLPVGLATVSAHDVQPTKSDPDDGTASPQSPEKVTVWFPEEAEAESSTLEVFDAQGLKVDLGGGGVDLNDASHQVMVVDLPTLPQGVYTVRWSISLTDGDSSAGSFYFGVGNVSVPTSAPEPTEAVALDPAAVPASDGQSSLLWFAGGAAVLVAAILFFVVRRRGTS